MSEVFIRCNDGKEYIVTEQVRRCGFEELVNRREFNENWQDAQLTLLALSRGSKYALEHGLACPRDLKKAVSKIKGFKRY